ERTGEWKCGGCGCDDGSGMREHECWYCHDGESASCSHDCEQRRGQYYLFRQFCDVHGSTLGCFELRLHGERRECCEFGYEYLYDECSEHWGLGQSPGHLSQRLRGHERGCGHDGESLDCGGTVEQ